MATTSPLRRRMIEDMTIRNLSPATQQSYLYAVARFGRYFKCSSDRLMGIMNNVSVPFGSPYIGASGTYPSWWRSLINLTDRVYVVQTTITPNVFWVEIDKLKNGTRRLPIYDESLVGEASGRFKDSAQPF